jgi:hypothetical protein
VTGEVTYGFTARIRGEGSNGFLMSASFQTLGGYTIEENLESGAPQQLAGWLTLTGALVDASDVPVPSAIISNSASKGGLVLQNGPPFFFLLR